MVKTKKKIEGLAMLVAQNLNEGEDPAEIANQLVANGWEKDDAVGFVSAIQTSLKQRQQASSGGGDDGLGWLAWIGGILLLNFLSWVFGWDSYLVVIVF